ncbi:hypothetical protein ACMD2_23506 [Ananas comosus]|uniref:Uncharacterized protein n=1 Tax=Ananas comosus TaxID=4615 RepID=A0A199VSP4_ANACO|nr:hypothetical protein ACMD2_23506 [Ananas comosus]
MVVRKLIFMNRGGNRNRENPSDRSVSCTFGRPKTVSGRPEVCARQLPIGPRAPLFLTLYVWAVKNLWAPRSRGTAFLTRAAFLDFVCSGPSKVVGAQNTRNSFSDRRRFLWIWAVRKLWAPRSRGTTFLTCVTAQIACAAASIKSRRQILRRLLSQPVKSNSLAVSGSPEQQTGRIQKLIITIVILFIVLMIRRRSWWRHSGGGWSISVGSIRSIKGTRRSKDRVHVEEHRVEAQQGVAQMVKKMLVAAAQPVEKVLVAAAHKA